MADIFSRFLPGLRSHSASVRIRTARALRVLVESESRDLSSSLFVKYLHEISKRILELLHGSDQMDRIGGIVAMDELVDLFNAESSDQNIIEFAHALAKVLERASNSDALLLRAATKALGHLVSTGGTPLIEFVEEYHMKPAMTWLENDSYMIRRHAAVMILKELAVNAPSIFYRYVDTFFEVIWPAMNDSKAQIRESAADALQASLALIHQRETNRKGSWYARTLDEVERGLIKGTAESMHGSLLTMNELLRNTGDFMYPHFEKVCKQVLQYKDHKSSIVRRAVINLLPRLAKFNTSIFIDTYLTICVSHLLETLRSSQVSYKIKGDAFLSLGKLSLAVGLAVAQNTLLERIFDAIQEGLKERRKKDSDNQKEALACLRMMAEAIGPTLSRVDLEQTIDVMFQNELNRTLVDTLSTLIKRIPNQKSYIQVKLFKRIQHILTGGKEIGSDAMMPPIVRNRSHRSNTHGSFLSIFTSAADMVREKANTDPSMAPATSTSKLVLALETLGTFDLQANRHIPVMQFVHNVVVRYLDSDIAGIRKAAAITCCKLVLPPGEEAPTKGEVARPVSAVLDRLLTVGIADTEADIRSKVLASLDSRFDSLLGQTENLRCLFIALNDEIFEIRETSMEILGRLTLRNPSYVIPALRQTLVQLLAELEFSGDCRGKEEAARLLGHLIRSAAHLARPFVGSILKALMRHLHCSSSVGISVLATLGELALVGTDDLKPYWGELLPEIYLAMQEQSSPQKLQVAIRTLGQLVSSTGCVIRPYYDYPGLLEILCRVLQKSGDVNQSLRLEAGRTLGILGALDPYSFKRLRVRPRQAAQTTDQERKKPVLVVTPVQDLLPSLVSDPSQYLPTVAVNALIRILNDPRNTNHYQGTILAIMYICSSMRKKVEPHLDKIIPAFLYSLDTVSHDLRAFFFEQLAGLVRLVGNKIEPHLNYTEVAAVLYNHWDAHLNEILTLFEEIARSLGDSFKVYLPDLLPELLKIIRREREKPERSDTVLVLRTFVSLGRLLDGYLHLVIPVLVKLIQSGADVKPRRQALTVLRALVRELDVSEYASKIIHMLARMISSSNLELVTLAMDCLCSMIYTLGEDYAVFVPVLTQVLKKHNYTGPVFDKYDLLVSKILKYQPLPMERWIQSHPKPSEVERSADRNDEVKTLPINQNSLMKAWESSQRSTKDDWYEWMRAFSVELLRESPSPALRACKELATVYRPLAQELFNAAFVSVWPHLSPLTQDNLVRSLETAFQSAHLPAEILQTLLNLAEFMEHDDQPLPIDIRMLGALAEKCHSFAKALHYKELEFNTAPSSEGIDALITINNKLNQFEAAVGILKYSQLNLADVQVKASWHEKLNRWDDALKGHDQQLNEQPDDIDAIFGKMRCLYALGQWRKLNEHVKSMWTKVYGGTTASMHLNVPPAMKKELCSHAARVSLTLQNWDLIPQYINSDMDEAEAHLFRAVCAIRSMELEEAQENIYQCRHVLDPTIRSLVSESYSRAYMPGLIYLQNLAELEEIVQFTQLSSSTGKTSPVDGDQLQRLRTIWTSRMLGVERNILVWQHLLIIRSLVLDPKEDTEVWLKYSKLCRKEGHMNLALSALWRVGAQPFIRSVERNPFAPLPIVLHGPDALKPHPRVAFSYIKHLWADGQEEVAARQLSHLSEALEQCSNADDGIMKLRVKGYIQLSQWQMMLLDPKHRSGAIYDQVLVYLDTATNLDTNSYRAWHEWALMNFRATEACAKEDSNKLDNYVAPSVNGFFRSIVLGLAKTDVTKDVLRLLTLWFSYGHRTDVHTAMSTGFHKVSIDTWLDVIPQLIARIHTPNARMNSLLHELLSRIGRVHPQALIYPITVAAKSVGVLRKQAADGILADVRRHSPQLVNEAELVSRELIRVAILWNELWYEALEEASRCYFNLHNAEDMINALAPLNEMLESAGQDEPLTLRELAFYQAFARDLKMAQEWTKRYQETRSIVDLNQAWDIYYTVFAKIRKQLNNLSTLELANVAPKLIGVRELTLAIPGTYRAGAPVVRIQSFSRKMIVLSSKQRPRKVTMMGSDGQPYAFLLKGHEDLRQDERVMQVFGLINTLLANDNDTSRRNLAIQRYSVLPLSHSSGLIGWVPNCDTLHQLIRDYRDARKIQLNVEHRLMLQMAPDYDKLPVMQKVEAFSYALSETTGQDLYKVLWLKSQNSEVWLDRRRNYTRSLAVMSMAGYILGLGDRHPSNLMLDRSTGRIVHIDFGDCFEVAMERDKYPEKIPFRLTRMLTQAMEVSRIEGNYRFTCERVMRVLRDNRDSLMAVLEAFIHDPLITWRLLAANAVPSRARRSPNSPYSTTGSVTNDNSAKRGHRRRNSSTDTMYELMQPHHGSFKLDPETTIAELDEPPELGESVYNTIEGVENAVSMPEELNAKALKVIDRVKKKLRGRDFDDGSRQLSVEAQVDRLIRQASSHENLCQLYYGWCPFW